MKSKKGVELTLNVIIIAILVLIVLAVLIYIFVGQSREFAITLTGCEERYGMEASCMSKDDCVNQEGRIDSTAKCEKTGTKINYCCVFGSKE